MTDIHKQDLETLLDSHKLSRFQVVTMVLCAFVAMLDGFDTQAIAFVAPEIASAWHVSPALFGPVFGAGLMGGLIGAIVFGGLGDRLGRKPVLVAAMLVFAVGSLLTPFAESIGPLVAMRLLTGLGLGGALPCFVSLTSEYAPRRTRSTLVALMFCGFPLGAVIGGVASTQLIPHYGWESVFIVGGVLPLLLVPIVCTVLPESLRFLALKQDHTRIEALIRRMGLMPSWNGQVSAGAAGGHAPTSQLFKNGRAAGTLLIWLTLFSSLLLTYFLVNWIPLIARQSGLSIQAAVLAVSMLNFGSIFGALIIGRLADRMNPAIAIGCGFSLGAVAIALLGHAGGSVALLCGIAFAAGVLSIGAQMCTVALTAVFYDTFLRATGIGWSIGVGRFGAIVGPVVGGILLGGGMGPEALFGIAGGVSACAAFFVLCMGWFVLRPRRAVERSSGAHQLAPPVASVLR